MAYDHLFSGLLIQTCVVYRRQQSNSKDKADPFGQPTRDEKEHTRFPCRCSTARGQRSNLDRMQDVVNATHTLFLEPNADVLENDVVTVLQAPPGAAAVDSDRHIVTKARVNLVRPIMDGVQLHHLEADLTAQRAATGVSTPDA
jgi:hypothetical protein